MTVVKKSTDTITPKRLSAYQQMLGKKVKWLFALEFQFQKQTALDNREFGWYTRTAFDLTKGHKACTLEGWTFIEYVCFYVYINI